MNRPIDKLRNKIEKHIEATDSNWNTIAKELDIIPQTLYAFKGGGGITFDNAMKLIKYLGLTLKELK